MFLGFVLCCFSSGSVVYFIAHICEITSLLLVVVSWLRWRHYLVKFPTQSHLCSPSDFKALLKFIWEGSLTREQASHWRQQRQTSGSVLVKSSLAIRLLCSEYASKLEHKVEWYCKWIQFKLKIQAQRFTNYYLSSLKQKSVCLANRQIKASKRFNTSSSNSSLVFHTYIYWNHPTSLY